jgi:hypothetical protein
MQINIGHLLLGIVALTADLISIAAFVTSGQVTNFWSATWIVMLVVIVGLLALGLFFIQESKSAKAIATLPIISGVYGLLACGAVVIALVALGDRKLEFSGFLGALLLMIFPVAMAAATGEVTPWPDKVGRIVSYMFAVTGLIAFVLLAMRYMKGTTYAWSMLGEAFVLLFIWAMFGLFAYAIGEPRSLKPAQTAASASSET